jgi:hypothetical protein
LFWFFLVFSSLFFKIIIIFICAGTGF